MRNLLFSIAMLACAAPAASAAGSRWTMVRTESMTVIGDQPGAVLGDIAVQLEQFRAVVGGLIHNADRPPALPTVVYVFGTRKAMQPYAPVSDSGKPASFAGYFQRDADTNAIVLSLEGFEESAAVAYHEYTHLLVGNAVRSVPVWLNEGLAEYYSTYRLAASGREAEVGRPPEGRLALARERSLPLSEVIAVDASSALYNEGNRRSIFYAEAWALTHYVLSQLPRGGEAINGFVAEWAEGRTPDEAFRTAFGASPAEFDKLLRAYVRRPLMTGTRFTFKDKLTVPQPGPPRALTAGEAEAWLGDLQRRLGREAEAAPRIDAAVMAEPGSPVTHLAAGLLRLAQQRTREGLLELERAAALAPDDFISQYLHGVWLLRTDPPGSPQSAGVAAGALRRAIAIQPGVSEAHAWLAYALMQDEDTLVQARESIERAIAQAPGRADYRLRWADIRILQGGYADARTLLTAIAALRTDPRSADGAARRLQTLDDFEWRAAARQQGLAPFRPGVEVPAAAPPAPGADTVAVSEPIRLALRPLAPGEQRAWGVLTRIECGAGTVRFHVAGAGRTIVTSAARMEDVALISYLNDRSVTVACGVPPAAAAVFTTWVPDASPSSGRDGVAIAIEFLPKGYVP